MVKKAYKFRFYPTGDQVEFLAKTFGCVRYVYNSILKWRTDAYYERAKNIGYLNANARLTSIKKDPELYWLCKVSSVPLQQCLRHQQTAFKNFFEGRAKYPTFKKKNNRQSFELTYRAFSYRGGEIYIAKCKKPLDIRWSRELPSNPTTVTISKDSAGRYFVSCLCEFKPKRLTVIKSEVGIDLGINDLFVTDTGSRTGNPKYTAKYAAKLAKAQKALSKKKLGSCNRAKAKKNVARIHAKISDCRRDNLHQLSRRLINENQVVCMESLKVKNMVRNRRLSKSISDAGWGEFSRQVEYKAEHAGRTLVKIDQYFPSSKRCSDCGHIVDKLPLSVREWDCPACGSIHDRDINAARNIKAAGLAVLAFGENVNLKLDMSGLSCPC